MDCKEGTARIIHQIQVLLQSIDPQQYSQPLAVLHGASLGQHFRHIHDFYDCLLEQVADGKIDYTLRRRNPEIEQNPLFAATRFATLLSEVLVLEPDQPLQVRIDFDPEATKEDRSLVVSSVGRELMYAHDHALHHLAIVKIGLQQAFPGFTVPEEIGVAASTLQFRLAQQQKSE